jgi:alkylation response protein AidB-like acyl-CoA dehydrogenase
VDLAAAYARERMQFGKPIGANQAVKHLLATCQTKIEFARPVVYAAAAQIGQQDLFSRARISHAKLAALAAADLAARTAIQVHGAMGYSWEVDAHFYLKRTLALTGAWGDEAFHRARFAERVLAAPLDPGQTFASAAA